jgi:hypothetical protein
VYSPSNYNPRINRESAISKPIDYSLKYSGQKEAKINSENKIAHR